MTVPLAPTLRKALLSDAGGIGALHVACWRETYGELLADERSTDLSVDARTAMWAGILGKPGDFGNALVLIAEADGQAVGFCACADNRRDAALGDDGYSAEIGAIYILRSHQRGGTGRSMMAAMRDALSAAGHDAAYLWVWRQNHVARRFYERLGGIIVGEKIERIDPQSDMTIVEDAYGWCDLSCLGD